MTNKLGKPSADVLRFLELCGRDHFFPQVPQQQKCKIQKDLKILDEDRCKQAYPFEFIQKASYLSHNLNKEMLKYPTDIDEEVVPQSCITMESSFDVISFLSCDSRDYLIRNGHCGGDDRVKVKSLKGKFVMVCCLSVPVFWDGKNPLEVQALSNACSDLYELRNDFEVVIVAKMRPGFGEPAFDHFMSGFPSSCLAVPFGDLHSREYICRSLNYTSGAKGLLVGPNQKVLWHKSLSFMRIYGADAFPFTDQTINALHSEEYRLQLRGMSLDSLLCCNPSDMLSKNPGGGVERVPISQLNGKLVGVYLCTTGAFLPKLQSVYDYCRAQGREFEIVVVYLPLQPKVSQPQLFQEQINLALEKLKMSCWVLPFRSWVSLKLSRLTKTLIEDGLLIVGPHGKFVDPFAHYVIKEHGLDTYPFTREVIFRREVQRIRTLTLESLLVYGSRDYVHRGCNDADRVPVAALQGRNIVLYLDYEVGYTKDVYDPLIQCSGEIKAKDSSFEVVFLRLRSSLGLNNQPWVMPWMLCPYQPEHSDYVAGTLLKGMSSSLIAFGSDGKICSIFAHRLLSSHGANAYPFGDNLREDVIHHYGREKPHKPLGYLYT